MLLSDVTGRALLVDCDGEWRSSTLCMVCWIQRPLDVCDIIIRGQSVCIRDDSLFFCCLFLFILTDLVISDHVKTELRDLTCA